MKKFLMLTVAIMGIMLASCGDDDEKVKLKDQTMYSEDTYVIENGENAVWESSNPMVASVENNVVTANCAGKATISSSLGSFEVTVKTRLNTFMEPCTDWGASQSHVKSYMNGYSEILSSSESIAYNGKDVVEMYLYSFQNSALTTSSCIIPVSNLDADTMVDFISERYYPYYYNDDMFMFMSPDEDTIVVFQITTISNETVYMLVYTDGTTRAELDINSLYPEAKKTRSAEEKAVEAVFQRLF